MSNPGSPDSYWASSSIETSEAAKGQDGEDETTLRLNFNFNLNLNLNLELLNSAQGGQALESSYP